MEWTFDSATPLAIAALIGAWGWYSFWKKERENQKINRAIEEQIKRKAESKERYTAYLEDRRSKLNNLKRLILDDFKLIRRGEKRSLGPEALVAVIALKKQHGDHPDTLNAWQPVIESLKGEISDADAAQELLDDLLYPDALEDIEELKQRIVNGLNRAADNNQIDPTVLEAAQALRKIEARAARKKREEWEAEARELRQQKEQDQKFREAMAEMASKSARNIGRMYGLPIDAFDGLSPEETLIEVRTLRAASELAKKPIDEREEILQSPTKMNEFLDKLKL
ncbi:MAG TPA: hypothetical protein VMU78_00810 [Methylocella sp.]|nr:hypothetical protein [Methylocella sp.]